MTSIRPITLDELLLYVGPAACDCGGVRVRHEDIAPQIPGTPSCSFCGFPLTTGEGAWLEFFDGLTLQYPGKPENLLAAYAHDECGPENGYTIDFARLLADGIDGGRNSWYRHLLSKRWFCATFWRELDQAYTDAQSLVAPMRSVVDSIPRRKPRTPNNPRAISTGTRTRVLERDGFKCRRCGHGPDVAPLVVDHIIPVAKGGTADFDNLQTLCTPCNAGKSDREPTPHDLGAR